MCITVLEGDIDHNEVVNMFEVVANLILVYPAGNTSHNEVS